MTNYEHTQIQFNVKQNADDTQQQSCYSLLRRIIAVLEQAK